MQLSKETVSCEMNKLLSNDVAVMEKRVTGGWVRGPVGYAVKQVG